MIYELTKDLETGNTIIDGEHRELFRAVNTLLDACSQGKGRAAMDPAMKFLMDYVDKHFAHEEQLQMQSKYPNMATHKTFHTGYKQKLRDIAGKIPPTGPSISDLSSLNMHIGTLLTHIRTEDKKLGEHLKNA